MNNKEGVLSEIKTCARILNTWGDAIGPSLDGKEATVSQRLRHFVALAQGEFGMTLEEIESAISDQEPEE